MQPEISVAMTLPVGITIAKATMASRFSISFSFFTDMYRLSHYDYLISQCKCVVGIYKSVNQQDGRGGKCSGKLPVRSI